MNKQAYEGRDRTPEKYMPIVYKDLGEAWEAPVAGHFCGFVFCSVERIPSKCEVYFQFFRQSALHL